MFKDSVLLDANKEAVMMDWEKPLMLAHANLISQSGGDILNVGFGLGLVDDAIQGCGISALTKSFVYVYCGVFTVKHVVSMAQRPVST